MNYYPFHLGDYAAHTAHLEPMEDLAYRRMLDAYYLREAPLPADPSDVARLVRMRKFLNEVKAVLEEFFQLTDEGWTNARCAEEILRMQDKQAKARASAAASVSARRAKSPKLESERSADVERTLNERSADVELPTPTPTPTPNISADADIKPARAARFNAQAHLVSLGVDAGVAKDWLAHRKAKRAPPSPTAIGEIAKEAAKARVTLSEALSIACQRGWTGFEADWIARDSPRQAVPTIHDQRAATIAALTGRTPNERPAEPRDITAEAVRVA